MSVRLLNSDLLKKAKEEANNEISAERFSEVKEALKSLYAKKAKAEKLVSNIDREIADFELEILGE